MAEKYTSKVKVMVRIRPFLPSEVKSCCVNVTAPTTVELRNLKFNPPTEAINYKFDACYDVSSTQHQIFDTEIAPILGSLFDGLNTTIFAYGMTGAGKTHTMQGSASEPGIIPRVAERILQMVKQREKEEHRAIGSAPFHSSYQLSLSYLELYNEKVYDLLHPTEQDLPIREDAAHNIVIPNLAAIPIDSFQKFAQTYELGCKNRTTAETKLNASSSRSHAIICIKVQHQELTPPFRTLTGKLHLIDLAGSEDNRRTDNKGVRLIESANINTSLFVLGKVVTALNDGSVRIPYRDSKLTRLLQDSLGGRSCALLIANIAPGQPHYFETFNTLNFASKSRSVVNTPVVNTVVEMQPSALELLAVKKAEAAKRVTTSTLQAQPMDTPMIEAKIEEKLNQKFAELAKKQMLSPWVRKRKALEGEQIDRIEQIERMLHGDAPQSKIAKPTAPTPFTKTKTVRELIIQGKALEDVHDTAEAVAVYRRAIAVLATNPTDEDSKILAKLTKKIEKLENAAEGPESPSVRVLNFNNLSAVPTVTPVAQPREPLKALNVGGSTAAVPAQSAKKSPASQFVSPPPAPVASSQKGTGSGGKSKKEPKEPAAPAPPADRTLEELLDVLNSGTLLQLMELHGVGTKRASLIISRRELKPFLSIEELAECGFGGSALSSFTKRNLTERPAATSAPVTAM